jgi:hypothetical protein
MKVGDKVRIIPEAWARFVKEGGPRPGEKFNPGVQPVVDLTVQGRVLLAYPHHWWAPEDLVLVPEEKPLPALDKDAYDNLTRAFCAVMEMWGRRYDYDTDALDQMKPTEGEAFPGPVAVDLGQLAVAHTSLLAIVKLVNPELYQQLFAPGAAPDAPLPSDPSTVPGEEYVADLDEVRIRLGVDIDAEAIAYVEAVWGKDTYGFNAAIQDLEALRRGRGDGALRRPETYHEGMLLVHHVRALANDMARNFGMDHLVREEDDLGHREDPK